jgi:hypothetical protein
MPYQPRALTLFGTLTLLTTFMSGCAAPNDDETSEPEEVAEVEAAATACNYSQALTQQQNATKAFKYALGGSTNPASGSLGLALTNFRTKIAEGKIQVYSPVATTVCGRLAGKARVAAIGLTVAEANQLKGLGDLADSTWGSGASNFLYVDGATVRQDPTDPTKYIFTAWFDPEPAKLTQSLSGSTGATAAAVYVNSGIGTSVIKWVSTAAAGSVAAGTPCTTGDASVDTQTTKVIQVLANGYRRCL